MDEQLKKWINQWEEFNNDEAIKKIDNEEYSILFKMDDTVYGSDENGRMVFAKMKDKNDEDYSPELSLVVSNLKNGEERVFDLKSGKKLKVIDSEEAKKLIKQ